MRSDPKNPKEEYTVSITFETTVEAASDNVAEQSARKTARSMDRDAANSHMDLANVDVEPTEE